MGKFNTKTILEKCSKFTFDGHYTIAFLYVLYLIMYIWMCSLLFNLLWKIFVWGVWSKSSQCCAVVVEALHLTCFTCCLEQLLHEHGTEHLAHIHLVFCLYGDIYVSLLIHQLQYTTHLKYYDIVYMCPLLRQMSHFSWITAIGLVSRLQMFGEK